MRLEKPFSVVGCFLLWLPEPVGLASVLRLRRRCRLASRTLGEPPSGRDRTQTYKEISVPAHSQYPHPQLHRSRLPEEGIMSRGPSSSDARSFPIVTYFQLSSSIHKLSISPQECGKWSARLARRRRRRSRSAARLPTLQKVVQQHHEMPRSRLHHPRR